MEDVRMPSARRLAGLGLAAVAAFAAVTVTASPALAQAPVLGTGNPNAIPGAYIVVLKDKSARPADLASQHGAKVGHVYSHALRGFSARMSEQAARQLAANPAVDFVEQDATVSLDSVQSPVPSWGLDRTDQRDLPLTSSYSYPDSGGGGVTAYIIDTGIRITHADFGGRAVWGINTTGDGNNTDCNGHGTHVAGTVAGAQYGVAKQAGLVAVKVLNCAGSGTFSGVAAGIDFVTGHHQPGAPAVANMSLGATGSDAATETAVRNSIADGVAYAIASGNSNADACTQTPARVAEAITVNASINTDARASFSNYGTCTDIFAPGQGITSAWHTSDTAANTISGTSMATPHVAGAAALILGAAPSLTPAQVWNQMAANATPNKITNPGAGSPNRLLFAAPPSTCAAVTNGMNYSIPDYGSVESPITISGCSGNASSTSTIEVHIVHTFIGDLVVDLIAPDGTTYNLHNLTGSFTDDINTTYTRNLSTELANGTWRLRVRDVAANCCYLDSWTLDL
jgi:subtilisin family serine protease